MIGELVPIVQGAPGNIGAGETGKPLRESVGGTLADVWQGIVGDRVAAWRISNAAAISARLTQKLTETGTKLDRSKLSDRYAFTWFEEATKQDEPEIQELFARLLLRAAQGDRDALDRRHMVTLSQFTPSDALIFKALFPAPQGNRFPQFSRTLPRWTHEYTVNRLVREHGEAAANSVEHLINLGVLARGFELKTGQSSRSLSSSHPTTSVSVKNEIIATGLGWSLQHALREDDAGEA